jgi:hypothetical protein
MEDKLRLLYPSIGADVLALVVSQAESFVLDYCNLAEIPDALSSVVLDMCKQDINRMLAEGIAAESAGGSTVTYESDYSPQVYKRLKKHKRLAVL